MADEEKPKRVGAKHAGFSIAGLAAGLALFTPMKELFITREEGIAKDQRIETVEKKVDKIIDDMPNLVDDAKDEIMVTIRRSYDNTASQIKEVESRYQRENDRQDNEIQALEMAAFAKLKKSNN